MLSRMQHMGQQPSAAMVPLRKPIIVPSKSRRDGQNSSSESK
jgi:hypothetical protein